MDKNTNGKCFVKQSEIFRILAILMIAVGLVLIALEIIVEFDTWAVMSAGVMLSVIGAGIYFFDSGRRVKDEDIEKAVADEAAAIPSRVEAKLLEQRHRIKEATAYELISYDFTPSAAESAKIKRGADGTIRSSRVCLAGVYIGTEDKKPVIAVYRREFSLIDAYNRESADILPEAELKDVSSEMVTAKVRPLNMNKDAAVEYAVIRLTTESGEISFTAKNDAATDEMTEALKRIAKKNKSN